MSALQLDLFEESSEICLLKQELEEIRQSQDNLRRGLFARHSELMKLYLKQHEEIDKLREMLLEERK